MVGAVCLLLALSECGVVVDSVAKDRCRLHSVALHTDEFRKVVSPNLFLTVVIVRDLLP